MASVFEAFDSTLKEAFVGLKVIIWSIPICIAYSMAGSGLGNFIIAILTILFTGYLAEICHNIVAKNNHFLPGVNVLSYGLNGLIATMLLFPFAGLGFLIWYLVVTFVHIPNSVLQQTLEIISAFFGISIVLASFIVYIRKLNPFDAYNMRKYFIGFFEVFLSFSFLVVKLALLSCVVIGFVYYLFSLLVGVENTIWTFVMCVVSVFFTFVAANYLAQVSDELFTFIEKADAEKNEKVIISRFESKNNVK